MPRTTSKLFTKVGLDSFMIQLMKGDPIHIVVNIDTIGRTTVYETKCGNTFSNHKTPRIFKIAPGIGAARSKVCRGCGGNFMPKSTQAMVKQIQARVDATRNVSPRLVTTNPLPQSPPIRVPPSGVTVVRLTQRPPTGQLISFIKDIREISPFGLKECKDFAEGAAELAFGADQFRMLFNILEKYGVPYTYKRR